MAVDQGSQLSAQSEVRHALCRNIYFGTLAQFLGGLPLVAASSATSEPTPA
jgi:hypothetical protein